MIYPGDINDLIEQWTHKVHDVPYNAEYIAAVSECIADLRAMLYKHYDEEASYQDYLDMEADAYLSSPEFYERTAI